MKPADELHEIKRAVKAVKGIAKDMAEIFGPSPRDFAPSPKDTVRYIPAHAKPKETVMPQNYSFVRCIDCDAPALLVRDDTNHCFAAMCEDCCTISYLETIVEERK